METQWQRALEMISNGNPDDDPPVDRQQSTKKNHSQRDAMRQSKGNEVYETPVNNRQSSNKFEDGQCGDDRLESFIDMVILECYLFIFW